MTRGELLKYSIAFALRKVRVVDRRGRLLSEDERYAVAEEAIAQLRVHGDRTWLDEEAPYKIGH